MSQDVPNIKNAHPDLASMAGYRPGEKDIRPWGTWEVLETGEDGGEEYCIKRIIVNPGGVLSLQSHKQRREEWTVEQGTLEVTRYDDIHVLQAGETIDIPLGAKHRMANRTDKPVVVLEIQRGLCREDDIVRYEDIYGRG